MRGRRRKEMGVAKIPEEKATLFWVKSHAFEGGSEEKCLEVPVIQKHESKGNKLKQVESGLTRMSKAFQHSIMRTKTGVRMRRAMTVEAPQSCDRTRIKLALAVRMRPSTRKSTVRLIGKWDHITRGRARDNGTTRERKPSITITAGSFLTTVLASVHLQQSFLGLSLPTVWLLVTA
ncbi:hypothetical protein ACRRTK_013791 [Alexandromys fortis]